MMKICYHYLPLYRFFVKAKNRLLRYSLLRKFRRLRDKKGDTQLFCEIPLVFYCYIKTHSFVVSSCDIVFSFKIFFSFIFNLSNFYPTMTNILLDILLSISCFRNIFNIILLLIVFEHELSNETVTLMSSP